MGDYREPKSADYLDNTVKDTEAQKIGTTSQGNFKPKHFLPLEEQVNITDAVVVNPNKVNLSEQVNITDAASIRSYNSGEFEVTEGADIQKLWMKFAGTLQDSSDNANHGTAVVAETYEDALEEVGFVLDGSTQKITLTNPITFTGKFVIFFRFKRTNNSTSDTFVGRNEVAGSASKIAFDGTSFLQLRFRAVKGAGSLVASIGYTAGMNGSIHTLLVKRDASNGVYVSLDGAAFISMGTLSGTFVIDSLGWNADGQHFLGTFYEAIILDYDATIGEEANLRKHSSIVTAPAEVEFADIGA